MLEILVMISLSEVIRSERLEKEIQIIKNTIFFSQFHQSTVINLTKQFYPDKKILNEIFLLKYLK